MRCQTHIARHAPAPWQCRYCYTGKVSFVVVFAIACCLCIGTIVRAYSVLVGLGVEADHLAVVVDGKICAFVSAGSRRESTEIEDSASPSYRSTQSPNSSSCASPASARTSAAHIPGNSRAPGQQVPASPRAIARTSRPLGEAAEEDPGMYDHHAVHFLEVQSPVVREGSAFSHTSLRDWQIKAGRSDSYAQGSRSSVWQCEWCTTQLAGVSSLLLGLCLLRNVLARSAYCTPSSRAYIPLPTCACPCLLQSLDARRQQPGKSWVPAEATALAAASKTTTRTTASSLLLAACGVPLCANVAASLQLCPCPQCRTR